MFGWVSDFCGGRQEFGRQGREVGGVRVYSEERSLSAGLEMEFLRHNTLGFESWLEI